MYVDMHLAIDIRYRYVAYEIPPTTLPPLYWPEMIRISNVCFTLRAQYYVSYL